MAEDRTKNPFVSPAWVDQARMALEALVAEYGKEGTKYSVCEMFFEAPSEFADDDGVAAWHFFVDGKSVHVSTGRIPDADVTIGATWETSLPAARLVYTPELIAERKENPPPPPDDPNIKVTGDAAALPDYLTELHNRMALVTE